MPNPTPRFFLFRTLRVFANEDLNVDPPLTSAATRCVLPLKCCFYCWSCSWKLKLLRRGVFSLQSMLQTFFWEQLLLRLLSANCFILVTAVETAPHAALCWWCWWLLINTVSCYCLYLFVKSSNFCFLLPSNLDTASFCHHCWNCKIMPISLLMILLASN